MIHCGIFGAGSGGSFGDPNGVRDNLGGVDDIAFLVHTLIEKAVTLVMII